MIARLWHAGVGEFGEFGEWMNEPSDYYITIIYSMTQFPSSLFMFTFHSRLDLFANLVSDLNLFYSFVQSTAQKNE